MMTWQALYARPYLLQHDDTVAVHDGGQPVRDHDVGAPLDVAAQVELEIKV